MGFVIGIVIVIFSGDPYWVGFGWGMVVCACIS